MKLLSILLLLLFPGTLDRNEYTKMYGEPLYITHDIEGTLSYDLSTIDPNVKIIFIIPIKVECKKDTIIIKPGFKKF